MFIAFILKILPPTIIIKTKNYNMFDNMYFFAYHQIYE